MKRLSACLVAPLWLALQFPQSIQSAQLPTDAPPKFQTSPLHPLNPPDGSPGFTLISTNSSGLAFSNTVRDPTANSILANGSGVAAGDVDGDGWCDLYLCGIETPSALFRNLGNWTFTDVTREAGVELPGRHATGAVFADVDGDQDFDLLVNSIGFGTALFLNDGMGRFARTHTSGLVERFGATSMALADIDGDDDLDLYVANYRTTTIQDQPGTRFGISREKDGLVVKTVDGRPVSSPEFSQRFAVGARGEVVEAGEADILYLNRGDGTFSPVSFTDGRFLDEAGRPLSTSPLDWGLAVMFRDMNQDLAPDIYVCNDSDSPDRIWINDGHGRFRALDDASLRETSLSSMGVDFADIDRDGDDDFIVLDMLARHHTRRQTQLELSKPMPRSFGGDMPRVQLPRNTLFLNEGNSGYVEVAQLAGLAATDWSWSPLFLDVDLDGFEDLLITNGFLRDVRDQDQLERVRSMKAASRLSPADELNERRSFPAWPSPNAAFRNRGDLLFQDASRAWGFDLHGISQGMAAADLDQDGDLDLVINNFNAPALLLRNNSPNPRIAVRLRGKGRNTRGIGARIQVAGLDVMQSQEMISGGRYLSGDDASRTFAAGSAPMTITVTWRTGAQTTIPNAQSNRTYEILEPR